MEIVPHNIDPALLDRKISEAVDLLRRAFLTRGDRNLLEQIKRCHDTIIDCLGDERLENDPQVRAAIESDPVWAGEVLNAAAHDPDLPESAAREARSLVEDAEAGDRGIGVAFATALIVDLPGDLVAWGEIFGDVKPLSNREKAFLAKHPSVLGARDRMDPRSLDELLSRGITPKTVLEATDAVWLAMNNLRNHNAAAFGKAGLVTSRPGITWTGFRADVATVLTHEIGSTTEVGLAAAAALLRWLVRLSGYRPLVFRGYFAVKYEEDIVQLLPTDATRDLPLAKLWLERGYQMTPALSAVNGVHSVASDSVPLAAAAFF